MSDAAEHVRDRVKRGNAADELATLVLHLGLSVEEIEAIASLLRNARHGATAAGRVLAFGERQGGAPGSNRGRTATDHVAAANRHIYLAHLYGENWRDDGSGGTGELHIANAAGRCLLAIEMIARGGG